MPDREDLLTWDEVTELADQVRQYEAVKARGAVPPGFHGEAAARAIKYVIALMASNEGRRRRDALSADQPTDNSDDAEPTSDGSNAPDGAS